jgi:hypothetical protein
MLLITGATGFVIEDGRKSAGQRFGPGVYRGQHQSQSKRRATIGVCRRRRWWGTPERHAAAVLAAAFGVLFIGVSARPSAACAVATFSERRTYVHGNFQPIPAIKSPAISDYFQMFLYQSIALKEVYISSFEFNSIRAVVWPQIHGEAPWVAVFHRHPRGFGVNLRPNARSDRLEPKRL